METKHDVDTLAPYAAAAQGSLLIWPVIGILAGLFFAAFHFDSPVLIAVAMVLYVVGVFGAVAWQAKKSGVQPRFGPMPDALKRNMFGFWLATTVLLAIVMVVAFTSNFLIAAVLAGLGFTVAGLAYHLRSRSIMANLLGA